ncbi:hypothetical protein AGMMS50284_1260 [Clostridia bacterium]|nr:hypothetical protein AGMMS50284_1260 [Clostridia bacterium]
MQKHAKKRVQILLYSGIVAFAVYILYAAIGNYLWVEYNPITTDISSLAAVDAPNQTPLSILNTAYFVLFEIFMFTHTFWSFYSKKHVCVKIGAVFLLVMSIVSTIGYKLFPLSGDKTVMTFGNMMHIIVTVAVVFLSVAGLYLTAAGYLKRKNTKKFGKFMIIAATVFTILGLTNPIGMGAGLNVLGLTERAAIYSLHLVIGIIGIYEAQDCYRLYDY